MSFDVLSLGGDTIFGGGINYRNVDYRNVGYDKRLYNKRVNEGTSTER